jgi:hypothetical protein
VLTPSLGAWDAAPSFVALSDQLLAGEIFFLASIRLAVPKVPLFSAWSVVIITWFSHSAFSLYFVF